MREIDPSVSVIMPVKNGRAWLRRSIGSALAQPQTGEIIVVDDGSDDGSGAAALACDDGSKRVRVITFPVNRGPSAARNAAIAEAQLPYLALLDVDDFLLPGRFARLFAAGGSDFDMIADDLIVVNDLALKTDEAGTMARVRKWAAADCKPVGQLAPESFIRGCISRRGRHRGELAFLKPVIRREVLRDKDLRYREELRLGEDYELYARALMSGVRFSLFTACGYVATVRTESLSGSHDRRDHLAMAAADRALQRMSKGNPVWEAALTAHLRHTQAKLDHLEVLDVRRYKGMASGAFELWKRRKSALHILAETLHAKLVGDNERDRQHAREAQLLIGSSWR